ncbi:SMP-30/gluconolactonase/LRE family protein [Massilia sp. TN1-12]|uniref:SMP-30/gluconolactonase/LRE family protein n=1 Tax=Massilia paldalensis TaxID=3377675 RepID=UPI00384CD18F
MMMELILDARNTLGEGILWDDRRQRLLWTDIEGSELWSYVPETGFAKRWVLRERLCSMALTGRDDHLLLGFASGLSFFDIATGSFERLHDVEPHLPTTRLNDGRVDREGRFVFGMFNQAENPKHPVGGFYRLNRDLSLEALPLGGVAIANSICFSPDGRTMYYADSATRAIRCCDYAHDGTISRPRVFARPDAAAGDPDGSTIDAEGFLWNARWGAGQVVRFAPDGRVDRILALPARQPTCVAFGGPGLDVLYATSASVGLADPAAGAGGLFAQGLDVRGLPEGRFGIATDA